MSTHLVARAVSAALASTLAAVLVAACGAGPIASPTPDAAHAEFVDPPFKLTLELPRTTLAAGEPIAGTATLEAVGSGSIQVSGSGSGIIAFEYEEVGGTRHVLPAWTSDCVPYRLEPGTPISSRLTKSGGFTADDPNAAFYRAFLADPNVHLPAGEWRITTVASFSDGPGCTGRSRLLEAPISVGVGP